MTGATPTIYTIGHSNHTIERFIEMLRSTGVTAIADVRSAPQSRFVPHFNKKRLDASLQEAGIAYVFLGDALGARPRNPACYRDGVAEYELIAASEPFLHGLDRVLRGAERYSIALLCKEREPLDCHRTILVARHLAGRGAHILHILTDGSVETHKSVEERLMKQADGLPLWPDADALSEAYRCRGAELAYRLPEAKARTGLR